MPRNPDHNSPNNERPIAEMCTAWGQDISRLEHIDSSSWRGEIEFRGLTLRPPQVQSGEWLCVMKGFDHEGGAVVAFHSARTGAEALAGAINRMANGKLTWKEDQFYGR